MIQFKVIDDSIWLRLQRIDIEKSLNSSIRKSIHVLLWESLKRVPVDTWKLKWSHHKKFENLFWSLTAKTDYSVYVHQWTMYQRSQPWLSDSLKEKEREITNIFERSIDYYLKQL